MTATESVVKAKLGTWTSWGAIALVATLAGLVLPQMMPSEAATQKAIPSAEAKNKPALDYTAPTLPDVPNPQAMFMRLSIGTAFVLVLCVASMYAMRRWLQVPGAAGHLPREMQLKETLQLGNRCVLHLVHLGKQPVLVGADAGGIKTIVPVASTFAEMLDQERIPRNEPEA